MQSVNVKTKISPFQLMMSVICFMQGSVLLSAFLMEVSKQDTWFTVIAGYGIFIALIAGYCKLMKEYPGKTIIEIFQITFGKIAGNILSSLLVFYFISIAALNSRDLSNFVVGFMPETPSWVILLLILLVSSYAVQSGIETLARLSTFFVAASFSLLIFHFIFTLTKMDMTNFLPVMQLPPIKYVQSIHSLVTILIGEIFVFTMIMPMVSDQSKVHRSMQIGLVIGSAALLAIIVRDVATLGRITEIVSLPSYESIRLINIGNIFTRSEILFAVVLLLVLFFKITVLFYAATIGIVQMFNLRSSRHIILALGFLIGVYAMFSFESSMENARWGRNTAAFFSTFFIIILPLVLAAGIVVRRLVPSLKRRNA